MTTVKEPELGDVCSYCGHLYVDHFLSPTFGPPRTHCTIGGCRYCGVFRTKPEPKSHLEEWAINYADDILRREQLRESQEKSLK